MSFPRSLHSLTFAFALPFIISPLYSTAHKCSEPFSREIHIWNITQHCSKKTLGTEFGWNYDNKSRLLEFAFGAKLLSDSGWLALGLNPRGRQMVGTRALIGFKLPDSNQLNCSQYVINENVKYGCPLTPSNDTGLQVRHFRFAYLKRIDYYVIRANILLSDDYNSSRTNVVWQVGEASKDGVPFMHSKSLANLDAAETIDLMSGKVKSHTAHERRFLRTVHGVLNIVGWGTLLPTGVIYARYFRKHPFNSQWWFIFHVGCQCAGYVVGLIGFGLGLWLGNTSKTYSFQTHRILGIIIFTFTTIQILALRLRPKKTDEYRSYWNMYHHFLGYALISLIFVNLFHGIKILEPVYTWKWAYFGLIGILGGVALVLESFSWIKFFLKKKATNNEPNKEKPNKENNQNEPNKGNPISENNQNEPNKGKPISENNQSEPKLKRGSGTQGPGRSTVQPQVN